MLVLISMSITVLLSISLPSLYQMTCGTGRPLMLQLSLTFSPALAVSAWSGDHSISGATMNRKNEEIKSKDNQRYVRNLLVSFFIFMNISSSKNLLLSSLVIMCPEELEGGLTVPTAFLAITLNSTLSPGDRPVTVNWVSLTSVKLHRSHLPLPCRLSTL